MNNESICPVTGKSRNSKESSGTSNRDWWPDQLNLSILHQHSNLSNPMAKGFNYADEFKKLDLKAIKKPANDVNCPKRKYAGTITE